MGKKEVTTVTTHKKTIYLQSTSKVDCAIESPHNLYSDKILGWVDSCQNFPHQVFCSQLKITIFFFCRAVQDDKLEWQNNPPCTSMGFWIFVLCQRGKDRIWKKGRQNFHAVTWQSISWHALLLLHTVHQFQWEDKVHDTDSKYYRARNKRACIDREQNSIFQSGEAQLGKFVFHRIIYSAGATGHHVTRFKFLFSATVSKTGGLSCSWSSSPE